MSRPDAPLPTLITLADAGRGELRVKRSRFLAEARPVGDRDAAERAVDEFGREHHDARHVCWGWRLGHGDDLSEGRSDGGEPSGSAGEPILNALRAAELVDAVVVVVRWFGGVKLGTGGLGRAYRDTAAAALDAAPRRMIRLGAEFELAFGYELIGQLEHLLARWRGRVAGSEFGESVAWRIWLPADRWSGFAEELRALTHDRVRLHGPL